MGGWEFERAIHKIEGASETLSAMYPSHRMLFVCLISVYFSETLKKNGNHPIHTLFSQLFFFCFRKRATILRMFIVPEIEVSGFTSSILFFTRNYILLNKLRIKERLRNLIKVFQQGRAQWGCSLESTVLSPRTANFLDGKRELCLLLAFPPATLSDSVPLFL